VHTVKESMEKKSWNLVEYFFKSAYSQREHGKNSHEIWSNISKINIPHESAYKTSLEHVQIPRQFALANSYK